MEGDHLLKVPLLMGLSQGRFNVVVTMLLYHVGIVMKLSS